MAVGNLLFTILTSEKDIVPSSTDKTFDKAIDLPAEDFGRVFDKRASSHAGFSATVLPENVTVPAEKHRK